ncbi:MAG: class I SAM-dependent rRNA methyltransferase [Terriglobales bacterium]
MDMAKTSHVASARALPGTPTVVISRRGAERLKNAHVWIYRSDVVSANEVLPGSLVNVADERGKFLGMAFYSSSSQIAVRMISSEPISDLPALLRQRVQQSIQYRERVVRDTDAYRVIFSEGDFLPGLIVDRYNDLLCLQVLTQAMDAEPVREIIISELKEQLKPASIIERTDSRILELEQLSPRATPQSEGHKTSTIFKMNGVRFHYESVGGQKTGAFLDQRENYAAAALCARGEALDVFCYQGGFALHLARNCCRVTGVDSSRPALEIADRNAALNGYDIEWIEANAFDLLRDYTDAGRQYDIIVLDPPAFAKSKRTLDTALRGYKELNLRALKMLKPGGILITCSCSYHVSEANFWEVVAEASRDAGKTLTIVENRGQSKDHPVLLNVPETAYLKCLICHVSN